MRGTFLLIAVLCAWLASHANRARQEQAALAVVQSLGGRVRYDWQPDLAEVGDRMRQSRLALQTGGVQPTFGDEPSGPRWLRQLIGNEYFQYITEVDIRGDRWGRAPLEISDEQLRLICSLKDLQHLVLVNTDTGDNMLRHVGGATDLRRLVLRDLPITNAGLLQLHSLHQLEQLHLINTDVTAEGVTALQKELPNCRVDVNEAEVR